MTILYIHQYFKTPETGPCRSWFIAKSMVENGHKVVLISGHNQNKRLIKHIDGIEVRYIPNLYKNDFGFYRRALSFFSFLLKAFFESLKIKADLVYASSTPLTVGCIALLLFKLKKKPYVFEVRDVWPKAPIELGYINHAWPKKLLYRLEKKIYQHAEKIIALSPPMEEHVLKITPEKPVRVIPNMSDLNLFSPLLEHGLNPALFETLGTCQLASPVLILR